MNITDEELQEEFDIFGHTLDNPDVIDKVKQLCQLYRMDATAFAAEWVAFSHTKGCQLSIETLDAMERERLSKKSGKAMRTPNMKKRDTKSKIYDISSLEQAVNADDADDLLDAYSTPDSKNNKKRQHTPDAPMNKRLTNVNHSPAVPFSPASLSPATNATPSAKYSSRTNGGEVVFSFGNTKNLTWRTQRNEPCVVRPYESESVLTKKMKYMFQKLTDKALVLNDMIEDMAVRLQTHHKIEEFAHVAMPIQDPVSVVGRICCDSDGKLNAKSVVLEGSRESSAGKQIPVDLSEVTKYSLFPGQIVAMDGLNSTGSKFVAKKVHDSVAAPLAEPIPQMKQGALRLVVACGPFTTTDSLMYEPLADLIKKLQQSPPDVCILLGPFVDIKNPEIEKGKLNSTYEEFFKKTIDQIVSATQRLPTQLVIVPSYRDVHHECVYPQPPFSISKFDNKRVHFVSDPSTLLIDDVVVGLTSTDVLFHLGAEEISSPPGSSDRLARLTQHILTQHHYYPLYPSADDVNIDYDFFEQHAKMTVTPHILIVPSDLRFFVKDVCGCCCVNPGRLAKGQVGGTYTRLHVSPPTGPNTNKPLVQCIAADVVRI